MSLASPDKPPKKARPSRSKDAFVDASDTTESRQNNLEPIASTSTPSEGKKKKKHQSKRTADEASTPHPPSDQTNKTEAFATTSREPNGDDSHKKKQKGHKHASSEERSGEAAVHAAEVEDGDLADSPPAAVKRSKDKKSKKSKHEGGGGDDGKESRSKGKETDGQEDKSEETESMKKSKKERKRKRAAQAEGDTSAVETSSRPPADAPKKKKRKHGKADTVQPAEDESLSEQASKALQYAFNQFHDPNSWKFNKARQNWLVRNIWSQEAIPEAYIPLTTQYLAGVRGGARDALIKMCRDILAEDTNKTSTQAAGTESATTVSEAEQPAISSIDVIKHARAAAVLAVLTDDIIPT